MARPYLILVVLTLLLAVCLAARRKTEQLACDADYYARAVMTVKNLARHGRGQAPLRCPSGTADRWLS